MSIKSFIKISAKVVEFKNFNDIIIELKNGVVINTNCENICGNYLARDSEIFYLDEMSLIATHNSSEISQKKRKVFNETKEIGSKKEPEKKVDISKPFEFTSKSEPEKKVDGDELNSSLIKLDTSKSFNLSKEDIDKYKTFNRSILVKIEKKIKVNKIQ